MVLFSLNFPMQAAERLSYWIEKDEYALPKLGLATVIGSISMTILQRIRIETRIKTNESCQNKIVRHLASVGIVGVTFLSYYVLFQQSLLFQ